MPSTRVPGLAAPGQRTGDLCFASRGFSLHENKLEELCRYLLRPPLANRLNRRSDDELLLALKRKWEVNTGCHLRNADGSHWQNSTRTALQWRMAYGEELKIYVRLQTSVGKRYLSYSPAGTDALGGGLDVVWPGI